MTFRFDPQRRLIPVVVKIRGPLGMERGRLALDTGASRTLVSPFPLADIGCDVSEGCERIYVTTGSQRESMPTIVLPQVTALGHTVSNLVVLAHQLPPRAAVQGLLGLDFFAGCRLELNFRAGTILLEPPHD